MPFKSKAQRRYMYSQKPELAEEFEAHTPEDAKLPERVKKMYAGGETNPKKETLSAMENNPTAGFADGGEVQSPGRLFNRMISDGEIDQISGAWILFF